MNRFLRAGAASLTSMACIVAALGMTNVASAQDHGIIIQKSCVEPKKVGDTLECTITITHDDGFGDTTLVTECFDTVDPDGAATRVPAVGNLPVLSITGNARFVGAVGTLPVIIGEANSTLNGLPGLPAVGSVSFIQNTYVIQPADPDPLPDRATATVEDNCDDPDTQNCFTFPNTIQFTAATDILNPAIAVDKFADRAEICLGDPTDVLYTFEVTNIGDADLENITIVDDMCGVPSLVTNGNGDAILDQGESWTYECTDNIDSPTMNTVTVSGTDTILGCLAEAMDTAFVDANAPPVCVITADGVCADSTGNTASVADAGPGATYVWTIDGDGVITNGQNTPNVEFSVGTTATEICVTVTDGNNCSCNACVPLAYNGEPDCTITVDPICPLGSGTASVGDAGAGAVYFWTVTGGSLDAGQGTTNISFTDTGAPGVSLQVDISTGDGCDCSDTAIVPLNDNPVCVIDAPPVCADSTGNMASVGDAGPGATYAWSITGGLITNGQNTPTITYSAGAGPIEICVIVTNADGCMCETCVDVTIVTQPDCTITTDPGPICRGTSGNMASINDPGGGCTINWSISAGSIDGPTNGTSIMFTAPDAPGLFTISVTIDCGNGCVCSDSVMVDVSGTGRVGDFVWEDTNGDGCQDPGEPGIDNVVLRLFRKEAGGGLTFLDITSTSAGGMYEFTDLCAGNYRIIIDSTTVPFGYTETIPNNPACDDGSGAPPDELDSDCVDGAIQFTLPTDNTIDLTLDCGFVPGDGEERPHPGWNWVDTEREWTANQPAYWSALTGAPGPGGAPLPPFTILDPSADPTQQGRPATDGSNDRVLRGFIYAWAVDEDDYEISWNHLKGDVTIVNYANGTAWEYNAWAFQDFDNLEPGTPLDQNGRLDIGTEYAPAFSHLLLDFYAPGSDAFAPGATITDTHLTLQPLWTDLRQETTGPVTTKASFVIWNEDETQFTNLHRCITCWDQTLLSLYTEDGVQNHFNSLQTDKGKARIDGIASQLCSSTCCLDRGGPAGCDDFDCQEQVCDVDPACCGTQVGWDLECARLAVALCDACDSLNRDSPLLGVAAKKIDFGGLAKDEAGTNLIGMGTESAMISYDPITGGGEPPSLRAPQDPYAQAIEALVPGLGRNAAAPTTESLQGVPAADRVSGTEKGSLLIFSKIELRWDSAGNVLQDTFVDLTNDLGQPVRIKLYFVNGDPPLEGTGP